MFFRTTGLTSSISPMPKRSLKGQVAIITGASRGIGRDVALSFAEKGVNVVLLAKSTEDTPTLPGTIYSVAKEVEKFGVQALPLKCDVRIDQDLENAVEKAIAKFGRIDIVINNAGALWWKDVVDTPMKRYDLINQINSRATFYLTKLCLPIMIKQGYGHIVTMSPPLNLEMLGGKVAYCISKFGMTLVAHGLAQEMRGKGIAINALWPATMVESYATINFNLGDKSLWRKGTILSDATTMIVSEDPNEFSGNALIDEEYMRSRGVTNFDKYRCDPNVEPPRMSDLPTSWNVGLVSDAKKSKL